MDMNDLKEKLLEQHDHPQRRALVGIHLDELASALAALAGFGHRLRVEPDDNPPTIQFPQMLHKADGSQLTVNSSTEAELAKQAGWTEHPSGDPDQPLAAEPQGQDQPAGAGVSAPVFTPDLSALPADPSALQPAQTQSQG